jgi:dienelactone hydrolase
MFRILTAIALVVAPALFDSDFAEAQLARQEYHSIPSAAMSPADFMTGKAGAPIALAGHLRIPKVGPDKQPAVILMHGGQGPDGMGGIYDEWTRVLTEAGIATFAVDSFTGRGIVNLPADVAKVGPLTRTVDAYRALEVLAKHPMIDPERIVIMGFSHGSLAAMYSNVARFRKTHGPSNVQFAAHISVYGLCTATFREDEDVTKPILMLHGTADDTVPIEACRAYADRLSKAGKTVRFIEYPDAHHNYDTPKYRQPLKLAEAVSPRKCRLTEGESGILLNAVTKQPFTVGDACMEKGITLAYQEVAAKKSQEDVKAFLKEVFQLK